MGGDKKYEIYLLIKRLFGVVVAVISLILCLTLLPIASRLFLCVSTRLADRIVGGCGKLFSLFYRRTVSFPQVGHDKRGDSVDSPYIALTVFAFEGVIKNSKEHRERAKRQGALPEGEASCCVCLGDFAIGELLAQKWHEVGETPLCPHTWHQRCIERWIREGSTISCPLCRESLISSRDSVSLSHEFESLGAQP